MINLVFKWSNILFIAPFFFLISMGCGSDNTSETSPLSPEESLEHFQLEKGFNIQLVASEPLVQAPVAMRFDARGRLWVVEMQGYMPDTLGTNEKTSPTGKIVILEDKNRDGVMDTRKVFLDSLILPRALCFYGDGVLVAEPPKLWFVKINGDTAGTKYVVDSNYAVGGNVEHQPNGLLRGLDNWIYSAKSAVRYKRINGKWKKEHTHFRGQWGITQDNYGRLFYNNNSANLIGDYFLPGLGAWNPDQRHVSGFDETIVRDTRTYPIHPTPGVNRGYRKGFLDDSLRLVHFTAACGPVIYRSNLFDPEYKGNAFVAGPAANLVKRDILQHKGFKVTGKQAYKEKEFLASDDERFRPVSLYNGPDGALYIVDMYRGIIQDVTYLTPYLKNQIDKRDLRLPLNRGRIYKIIPKGKETTIPILYNKSTKELVQLLDDPNAWVRKTVQRLIVDQKKTDAIPFLQQKLTADTFAVGRIQALWTLDGLGKLKDSEIDLFLHSNNIKLKQQAVAVIVSKMTQSNASWWIKEMSGLLNDNNKQFAPYAAFLFAKAMQYVPESAQKLLMRVALRYPEDKYVADAVISGLYKREKNFFKLVKKQNPDTSTVLYKHLEKVITNARQRKEEQQKKKDNRFTQGKVLFETYCKVCHGEDGEGIRSLGAPLNGSQWVQGDKETLLGIVLHGLTGPIKVGNKLYKVPEIGGEMPAFGENKELTDEKVAQILSYVRNAWNNHAAPVRTEEVAKARQKFQKRTKPFTMKELK